MRLMTFKFLRKSSKQRLFLFVPNLCTLANALFGFLAVVRALDADYAGASACIIFAACMDTIDGRIARFFGMTSIIGKELDALCDAVSFCCVPAIVMYCWCLHAQDVLGLAVLAFYLWCGLFRLARFNTTTTSSPDYFIGLPTTGAAMCLASLLAHTPLVDAYSTGTTESCWGIVIIVGLLAALMISTVRFPSGKRLPRSRTLRSMVIAAVCLGVTVYMYAWPLKLVVPFGYVIISVVADMYRRLRRLIFYVPCADKS